MFSARSFNAQDAGKHFAELVRSNPVVQRCWVSTDIDGFDVHVLTEPIDPEVERTIYALGPELRKRAQTVVINIRLVNPQVWDAETEGELIRLGVPPGASEVGLGR